MPKNNSNGKRVVITGLGVITAIGKDVARFWENLVSGKSGVSPIESFDVSKIASRIAAQIKDFDPAEYMDFKQAKRMDRFSHFAIVSSSQALNDSGIVIDDNNSNDIGIILGSGVGGLSTLEKQHEILLNKGANRVSPFLIPMMIPNMAAAQVSIFTGAKGPIGTTSTACAAGSNAIGDAFELIKRGACKIMIAGGSEAAITPMGMAGFSNMQAMSSRNDQPQRASRPFDKDRDGFVMGEGSGVLMLEELESALNRKAKIYAEIVGYGMTGEAYHMTAIEDSGINVARCIEKSLDEGQVDPEEVDYINAHGTSTPLNDVAEANAIRRMFKSHADRINVSSTKSMTGHCLGASGAIEAVATVLAVKNDIIPPTINLDNQDERIDLDCTPLKAVKRTVNIGLSNSMGFGGHNVTLVFRKYGG